MTPYSFKEKIVLVTGASGGLGSALVRLLAKQGARLVVTARSLKPLEELIRALPQTTRAIPVTADLSVPGEAQRLAAESLNAVGYIDVLFNNAGIGYFALMQEATEENIRHLFEVNTFSPLSLIKTLLPHMLSRGSGRIINIASCAGRIPIPTVGVYAGSKSALAVMTNTMRLELEPAGIHIVNIYPGTAATLFEENALREEARPGICPKDTCGKPRFAMAEKILTAAAGAPGEVWLQGTEKILATTALLWPRYVDRRLEPFRKKVLEEKSPKPRRWRLLQVESSLACNLRCIMCPWQTISKQAANRGIMQQAAWDAIRPHLGQAQTVDFTGGGEPLLQPRLVQWMADAKAAGCKTGLLTNGFLLKESLLQQLLATGIDWIGISMDGATKDVYEKIRIGSRFETVCQNVANIARLRQGSTPQTMINFVLMPINYHQVEEIVRLACQLGVDQVNFKQCDVIRDEHGKGFGLFAYRETREIRRLEKTLAKARRLARKLKVQTTSFPFTPEELPVCDQDPRNSMFIRHDGTVAPCINQAVGGPTTFLGTDVAMPRAHYGALPQENLLELWSSKMCRFFRMRFQDRVKTYEQTLTNMMAGSSSREKLLETARQAMPPAPKGCRICHYLFNI